MKKYIIILVILAIVASPAISMKNEKGAVLVVETQDGRQLQGELITVKQNSLLLMDTDTSADLSVGIEEIKFIRIVKPSKLLVGTGLGLLVGAACGAGLGFALGEDKPAEIEGADQTVRSASEKAALLAGLFGAIGAIGGGITGYDAGRDEIIMFEGLAPEEKAVALESLREHARVTDFQ